MLSTEYMLTAKLMQSRLDNTYSKRVSENIDNIDYLYGVLRRVLEI